MNVTQTIENATVIAHARLIVLTSLLLLHCVNTLLTQVQTKCQAPLTQKLKSPLTKLT